MNRVLPKDVVHAYRTTGLIPVRLVWTTKDERGGCAIDALAACRNVTTDEFRRTLEEGYEEGFLLAWDADDPQSRKITTKVNLETRVFYKRGYADGLLCRDAVEKAFTATGIVAITDV